MHYLFVSFFERKKNHSEYIIKKIYALEYYFIYCKIKIFILVKFLSENRYLDSLCHLKRIIFCSNSNPSNKVIILNSTNIMIIV